MKKALKKKIVVRKQKAVKKAKPTRPVKKAVHKKSVKKIVRKPAAPKRKSKNERMQEFAQAMKAETVEKKVPKAYPVLEGADSERITMLLPILRELVRKNVISDWNINLRHSRLANIYVERNFAIENELSGTREDITVTIYERFPDNTIGEAQIPIITTDPSVAKQHLMDAKTTCSYARKKAFDLPQSVEGINFPQSYDEKMLQAALSGNSLQMPRDVYTRIKTLMSPINDVKTNSFEILTRVDTIRTLNSNGIDISYHKTFIYTEVVLTASNKDGEREFIMAKMGVSPEQLDIEGLLLQQTQIVRDALNAKPNPGFSGDVLLAGPSVTEFFAPHHDLNPLVLHTFAKLQNMGLSSLKLGQNIGHVVGEPITVATNPALPLGLLSAPVDEEGTPLRRVELIRNGVFINYLATARYAQYLSVPATGMVSNIEVTAGATREEHLRGNNYFEIVAFSWFNPNALSGDFAAEIRLGYHWLNGKKTPFRGGTFTGNVFKNLLNVRLSKEITQSGGYYGPRAILFKQAQITKLE
jgi:predicted Zn-dependent protease